MPNVPTSRVLSNPKSSAIRLFHVLEDIVSLGLNNERKPTIRDNALIYAAQQREMVKGAMRAYKMYMEAFFANLDFFSGKTIVFLNGISPDLMEREEGNPGRNGYDAFAQLYGLSADILKMADAMQQKNNADSIFADIVLWPVQPVDMPFIVDNIEGLAALYPLPEIVAAVNDAIKQRLPFGSLEKRLNDTAPKIGNTHYSDMIFSYEHFKNVHKRNPSMDLTQILEHESREDFYKSVHPFILLNNEIMTGKYARIISELNLDEVYVYALKGSSSYSIMERAARKAGARLSSIGGDKGILGSKKGITQMAERDPSALRMLQGFISSMHARKTGSFLECSEAKKRETLGVKVFGYESCWAYQFFLCERGSYCSQETKPDYCSKDIIDNMPAETIALLDKLTKTRHFGIKPIEALFNDLNRREYELFESAHMRNSWIRERGNRLAVPIDFPTQPTAQFDLRASEFSGTCSILGLFAKSDKEKLAEEFGIELHVEDSATEGTAMHEIVNQHDGMVHRELLPKESGNIDRSMYGEKKEGVVYNYFMRRKDVGKAKEMIMEEAKRYRIPGEHLEGIIDIIEERFGGTRKIIVSGHPDAVGKMLDGRDEKYHDLIIADIKRAMYTSADRPGFISQALIYGLAVRQMMNLENENLYPMILQTPFDENAFLPEEKRDTRTLGIYRPPKVLFEKVPVESPRIDRLHADIIMRFAMQKYLLQNNDFMHVEKGIHLERSYRGCETCFEGPNKSEICPYTFARVENGVSLEEVLRGKLISSAPN